MNYTQQDKKEVQMAFGRWITESAFGHYPLGKFNPFAKLWLALRDKADADAAFLRWFFPDHPDKLLRIGEPPVWHLIQVMVVTLEDTDLTLSDGLQNFLVQEYQRRFVSKFSPLTMQEQINTLTFEGVYIDGTIVDVQPLEDIPE